MIRWQIFTWVLIFLVSMSCARAPLQNSENAMRKTTPPFLSDDLPLGPFLLAVQAEISQLEKSNSDRKFVFGENQLTQGEYLAGLYRFVELGKKAVDSNSFFKSITAEFDFYEVYGQDNWGQVFITSYFEPTIKGSLKKTKAFSTPIYQTPNDLLTLDMTLFDPKLDSLRKLRGRIQNKIILPYYSREEIDNQGVLSGKSLEICWVDPIDAFFLHIQGSGTIDLGNGKTLFLNYAEKNGHPYVPIGKFIKEYIPLEQLNLDTIETFLRSKSKKEIQEYLNKNPSYVFFKASDQHAMTYLGLPATDGRTIATDQKFFPKGAIAFLQFDKPNFENSVLTYHPVSRFVLDQDTGGAITGGGRVDLFWGRGNESKRHAGVIKHPGTLYYILPKKPLYKPDTL